MTITQLEGIGIPTNKWTTLEGVANSIPLQDNVIIFLGPKVRQVYFSSDGYMLVRKTKPYPVLKTDNKIPEGHVEVEHNGVHYIIPLEPGYQDLGSGPYHEFITLDTVTCINNTFIK